MDDALKVALGGLAVGYMTGELKIKDGMSGALIGGAIGLGIGYLLKQTGQVVTTEQVALNEFYGA